MNSIDFAKVFGNALPMIIGGSIGTVIAFAIQDRYPSAAQVRKRLGRALDRYTNVPADELNSALILAAADARRGFSALLPMTGILVMMLAAGLSAQLYRELFPNQPRWHSHCVAALVAGVLAWAKQLLEKRSVMSKLSLRLREG